MDSILKVPEQPLYQRFMRDKGGDVSEHPGTCNQPPRCGAPSKTYQEAFDPQGGNIGSEKIMSLCVGTGIYMHVWYSASLIGY